MNRCLRCCLPLNGNEADYHPRCAQDLFGSKRPPAIGLSEADLRAFAERLLLQGTAVTGVQPKLSLHLEEGGEMSRLTLVGMEGDYILKPQAPRFPQLPENEHLTMRLAALLGLPTAVSGLVRLADGSLGYITRRFDPLPGGAKLAMEDMAQLTETPTDKKYRSSLEKVAKSITRWSEVPGQDKLFFFLLTLHCYLTGNADMHLKNFALLEGETGWRLSPAFDLVNTKLALPEDTEDTALTLRGKKSRFKPEDLLTYLPIEVLGLSPKVVQNALERTVGSLPQWPAHIHSSFLTLDRQETYLAIVRERAGGLGWAVPD